LDADGRADVTVQIGDRLAFVGYAPVVKISALTGKGVHKLLPVLSEAIDAYHRRVPTRELNQVIQAAQSAHAVRGARVLYARHGACGGRGTGSMTARAPMLPSSPAPTSARCCTRRRSTACSPPPSRRWRRCPPTWPTYR